MGIEQYNPLVRAFAAVKEIDPTAWAYAFGASEPIVETIRNVFIGIDAVLFVAFIAVLMQAVKYRPILQPEHGEAVKKAYTLRDALMRERWSAIVARAAPGQPDSIRFALIEADKLADDVLKKLGFEGEHMADRLEQIDEDELRSLSGLWRAHRVRNNLVDTPGFAMSVDEAKKLLSLYEVFLKEVHIVE